VTGKGKWAEKGEEKDDVEKNTEDEEKKKPDVENEKAKEERE